MSLPTDQHSESTEPETTPLERTKRKLCMNALIGHVLLLLGNISHWLKEEAHEAFAIGTVMFISIGLLYLLAASFWLIRFIYLTWKE